MPRRTLDDVLQESDPLLEVTAPKARKALNESEKVAQKLAAFIERHGRPPNDQGEHGLEERLLAAEVSRFKADPAVAPVLAPPAADPAPQSLDEILNSDLLGDEGGIFNLVHVSARRASETPDYIGSRKPCADFAQYEALFDEVVQDLKTGRRRVVRFAKEQEIAPGQFFIQKGMLTYVAAAGETKPDRLGNTNRRLRVIYDNGTEGDPLLRSFSSKLYGESNGRRITDPEAGPLFGGPDDPRQDPERTGVIYVARSLSPHPEVARHEGRLHKIGVTRGDPEDRVRGAEADPTFLLAPAALVTTFVLHNIHPRRLERLLHAFLEPARADAAISDRFGRTVQPREWFFVSADVVSEVVELIRQGRLGEYFFEPAGGEVKRRRDAPTSHGPSSLI